MSNNIMDMVKEYVTSDKNTPLRTLMGKPGFDTIIIVPITHFKMNAWDLGRIFRKNIKIRVREMNRSSYKGIRNPSSNEMIMKVRVPVDYETMGNWDLGTYIRINIALKEMDESK